MVVRFNGQVVADITAAKLANEAPVYHRDSKEPEYLKAVRAFSLSEIADSQSPIADLKTLLSAPTIASKNWVYRQYDHMVRDGSVICPGSDAAVIRIKEDSLPASNLTHQASRITEETIRDTPEKLIAITVDGNSTYSYLDPYEGGKIAVAEAARNLACSGAT